MRQIQTSMFTDAIDESIAFMREHEPPEGYFLGFSGGKDSVVMHELARMAGVKFQAFYSATGIDPPEVVRFIRKHYPEVVFLRPAMSFWEGIRRKSPPLRVSRWCCDELKKKPSKNVQLKHRLMGIRSEESSARASRDRIDKYNKKQTLYKPIFDLNEWEIWEFIESQDLPYCSLYDEGFDRIGCVVCPFLSPKKIEIHRKRWPKYYEIFEKCVRQWWGTKAESPMTKRLDLKTADDYIDFIYGG